MAEVEWGQHDGPCLNYPGQKPEHYDQYDSCYLHIEASGQRKAEIVAIVRAVSYVEPLVDKGEELHGYWEECGACSAKNASVGEPVEHRTVCPWRRAADWVAAHPM